MVSPLTPIRSDLAEGVGIESRADETSPLSSIAWLGSAEVEAPRSSVLALPASSVACSGLAAKLRPSPQKLVDAALTLGMSIMAAMKKPSTSTVSKMP